MKNLYQIFSIRELAGMPLEELLDEIMVSAEAGFVQLFFDPVGDKKFGGNMHKFNQNINLADTVKRAVTNLPFGLPQNQPVIYTGLNSEKWEKQYATNLSPFEQLICLPLNEAQQKAVLVIGFLEAIDNTDELINDLQACNGEINAAINRYEFDCNNKEKKILTDLSAAMNKSISSQLSVAVDNIIANMAVVQKEVDREKLLEFSFSLTSIRNRSHLLSVVKNNLKKIVGFGELVILVRNENTLNSSILLTTMDLPDYVESAEVQNVMNDYFSRVIEHNGILVFNDQKFSPECNTNMACIGLKENSYHICLFFMYTNTKQTYTEHDLGLIKSIAYQLSPAIANVLANEDIQNREKEKGLLLAFSNTITSVRDKNVLAKILKQQLKDLFDITDYVIHSLSNDKRKYTPILFDPDANFTQYPDFKKLVNNWTDVNDGLFNKILAADDPIFFDIDECICQPGSPDYLKIAKAINLQQMIGVSIRLGQENIAIMTFIHNDYARIVNQYHLFKCILSQIALSISNMLANEKVNKQLEEINNYKHQLEEEKIYLKEEIETTLNYAEIVGESPVMQKVFRLVAQVAPSDSTVLLLGETGTGKELIARAIHNNSPRKNKLMVKVNCAALPANLIESELFGHERGSFTGATERRLGKFELANNGTLFLDEIGEMPLDLQVKLLRALQEREIERIGGNTTIKVNVRFIAATNRDLEKEMLEGRFRRDLYYRLNIFPIELPPLRSRKEDIPLLAIYFIQRFAKKAGKDIITLNNRALQELVQYKWPGNIRELEHIIERSVLLAPGDTIKQVHLPAAQQQQATVIEEAEFVIKTIDEHERHAILKTLKYCGGRIGGDGGAAMLLGLPTSTLNSRMKRLGIRKEHITW